MVENHPFFRVLTILLVLAFVGCSSQHIDGDKGFVGNSGDSASENQKDEYFQESTLRYDNFIYSSSIRTPQAYVTGNHLAYPFIDLSSDASITFSFDDLSNSVKDLYYGIVHCDANWQPSGLMEAEYLDGFFTYQITDFDFSFNTLVPFVHYKFQLPNERTQFKRSGNYLIKVFANNDHEQLLLTRRIVVYETLSSYKIQYKRATNIEKRDTHQEFDLTILPGGVTVNNPFTEIKLVLLQNGRWDNSVKDLQPTFVKDKELVFDLDDPNIFSGGNEYRFFDLKSMTYNTQNVARIIRDSVPLNVLLLNDEKRTYKRYSTSFDINGRFFIRNDMANDSDTESDYVYVYFYLPMEKPTPEGDYYIFGALSDWRLLPANRLSYNYKTQRYEGRVLLKQGFYNYSYALSKDGKLIPDEANIEGDHFDTENDYQFLIYFRDIRCSCDRIIGFEQFNTQKG